MSNTERVRARKPGYTSPIVSVNVVERNSRIDGQKKMPVAAGVHICCTTRSTYEDGTSSSRAARYTQLPVGVVLRC